MALQRPRPSASTTNSTASTTSVTSSTTPTSSVDSNIRRMMETLMGQSPETRFSSQLVELSNMGFVDREANLRALSASNGDINAAIEILLR